MRVSVRVGSVLQAGIVGVLLAFLMDPGAIRAAEPIRVSPHPSAGKPVRKHEPDRPLISLYGGIGLRFDGGNDWSDYGELKHSEIDYLLDRCAEYGAYRIHASLLETLTPESPRLSADQRKELVAYFFREANARGIEVFADIPVFGHFVEADREFVAKHPEAFTKTASGERDLHMLSAANEDVRHYKRSWLMSFVQNYPVSGLQLDFIRYPYYTWDLREGFGKHGYDPEALASYRQSHGLSDDALPAVNDPEWVRHKSDYVSKFIRELRGDLAASGIDLPIGVYNSVTYGREDSLRTVHQDWEQWEKEGLVDEHHPMILMSDGIKLLTRATQTLLDVQQNGRVFGPIFIAGPYRPHIGDAPTPDMVRRAARALIKQGCDGIWFCRSSEVEEAGLWPVLKEISEWSIREIRAEDFDPFAENLLEGAAGWKIEPQPTPGNAASNIESELPVRVTLSPNTETRLTQSVSFRANPQMSAQSLAFACKVAPRDAATGVKLEVTLHYVDGRREDLEFDVQPTNEVGDAERIVIPVKCDYSRHVLNKVDLSLKLRPGSGVVEIADASLERDPLLWKTNGSL